MKRIILFFLIVLAAIWVGLRIHEDPGYVLLAYQNSTVEMPLWAAVVTVLLAFLFFHFAATVLHYFGTLSGRMSRWSRERRHRKALQLTTRGFIALKEGLWSEAENLLIHAVDKQENPLINYLAAARAAQEQGDLQRRDNYLRRAQRSMPEAKVAVDLCQAQLQLEEGEYAQALALLERVQIDSPKHPTALKLLQQLYVELEDWEKLLALLPQLKKAKILRGHALTRVTQQAYCGRLRSLSQQRAADALRQTWAKCPRAVKQDPVILHVYIECLLAQGLQDEAEQCLAVGLKKVWDEPLVLQYGLIDSSTPKKALRKAEHWLVKHPHDPMLLLTLGRLCIQNQLWGKAKTYLENSLAFSPDAQTHATLAKLLENMGEGQLARTHYRAGLTQSLTNQGEVQ